MPTWDAASAAARHWAKRSSPPAPRTGTWSCSIARAARSFGAHASTARSAAGHYSTKTGCTSPPDYRARVKDHSAMVALVGGTLPGAGPAGHGVSGAPALAGDALYVLARKERLGPIPDTTPSSPPSQTRDIVEPAGPTPLQSGVLV